MSVRVDVSLFRKRQICVHVSKSAVCVCVCLSVCCSLSPCFFCHLNLHSYVSKERFPTEPAAPEARSSARACGRAGRASACCWYRCLQTLRALFLPWPVACDLLEFHARSVSGREPRALGGPGAQGFAALSCDQPSLIGFGVWGRWAPAACQASPRIGVRRPAHGWGGRRVWSGRSRASLVAECRCQAAGGVTARGPGPQ